MLRTMNTGEGISKSDYKEAAANLRLALLKAQIELSKRDQAVVVVIAGDDRSGRHESINRLMEWLDPRFIRVNAYGAHDARDNLRPFMWRFWRDLPSAGQLGVYLRAWTSTSIVQYLNDEIDDGKLNQRIDTIRHFEKTLADDSTLIIKVWLHLSKKAHKKRVKALRDTVFFEPKDELALKHYDKAVEKIERVLEDTTSPFAPWHLVNGDDPFERDIVVGEAILKQLQQWLDQEQPRAAAAAPPTSSSQNLLDNIDLTPELTKEDYEEQLEQCRSRLRELMNLAYKEGIAVVCAFEGVDAAGKGGAIRRIATALDAGLYNIVPVAKPTDEEYAHHYLWRFWKHLPADGLMTIFDRTWYGRVLVERVEGFADVHEWQRAYGEINNFEKQIVAHGTVLMKYWLHIDQDEQLARFEAREDIEHKKHKITDEDYRNRKKWPQYKDAIHDMITQTDTADAPWTIVPAQDKKYARIAVFEALIERLKTALNERGVKV